MSKKILVFLGVVVVVAILASQVYWKSSVVKSPVLDIKELQNYESLLKTPIYFIEGKNAVLFSSLSDGTNKKELQSNIKGFQLSPDGKKIVTKSEYNDSSSGVRIYGEISIIFLDKNEQKKIDDCSSGCTFPEWSPDSNKIAYQKEFGEVYIYDLVKDAQIITPKKQSDILNWTQNGSRLSAVSIYPSGILKWTEDGSNLVVYEKECDSPGVNGCWSVYNINTEKFVDNSKLANKQKEMGFFGSYKIHYNQYATSDSTVTSANFSYGTNEISISPDRKHVIKFEGSDCKIHLYDAANLEPTDYFSEKWLNNGRLLIDTSGCYIDMEANTHLNFYPIVWYSNNLALIQSRDNKTYFVDVSNGKIYQVSDSSRIGRGIVYIPNYQPGAIRNQF